MWPKGKWSVETPEEENVEIHLIILEILIPHTSTTQYMHTAKGIKGGIWRF
jgi:hypothetical protein